MTASLRANQAFDKFQRALTNLQTELDSDAGDAKSRNSALLTFMLTFETFWKALKAALSACEGVDAGTPKEALRSARQVGWLCGDEAQWLEMADDRNLIVHTYNDEQAETIFRRIKGYAPALTTARDALTTALNSKIMSP
ncbi:MAG: nucleotidyltransferase substrate binding protein [Vampirovibrionales bacterium]|nr:nucleotidyltransferase substrate binding protein [Vampirovibrionales bacterium]